MHLLEVTEDVLDAIPRRQTSQDGVLPIAERPSSAALQDQPAEIVDHRPILSKLKKR